MPQNRLLRGLPAGRQNTLAQVLEPVSLHKDEVLLAEGREITHAYFPTDSLVAMVVNLANGNTVEAGIAGTDGFVGIPLLFGERVSPQTWITRLPGAALRMQAAVLTRHLAHERLRLALGSYADWTISVMAQSTACIAFHPVHQRLARCLLMVHDSLDPAEFALTQETIAMMVGSHRPTVTVAMRALENAGLVEHRRGKIEILDLPALMRSACECYGMTARFQDTRGGTRSMD